MFRVSFETTDRDFNEVMKIEKFEEIEEEPQPQQKIEKIAEVSKMEIEEKKAEKPQEIQKEKMEIEEEKKPEIPVLSEKDLEMQRMQKEIDEMKKKLEEMRNVSTTAQPIPEKQEKAIKSPKTPSKIAEAPKQKENEKEKMEEEQEEEESFEIIQQSNGELKNLSEIYKGVPFGSNIHILTFSTFQNHKKPSAEELDESEFELTPAELKELMTEQQRKLQQLENMPLMTKSMRETLEKKKKRKYSHGIVRFRMPPQTFSIQIRMTKTNPDGSTEGETRNITYTEPIIIQANFPPETSIKQLRTFLMEFFEFDNSKNPNDLFSVFISPPVKKLDSNEESLSKTLDELDFLPAVLINVSGNLGQTSQIPPNLKIKDKYLQTIEVIGDPNEKKFVKFPKNKNQLSSLSDDKVIEFMKSGNTSSSSSSGPSKSAFSGKGRALGGDVPPQSNEEENNSKPSPEQKQLSEKAKNFVPKWFKKP